MYGSKGQAALPKKKDKKKIEPSKRCGLTYYIIRNDRGAGGADVWQ
jgi:hypothetical protein